MINKRKLQIVLQDIVLVVMSGTVPAFGAIILYLFSTHIDALLTELWVKFIYFIFVLISVTFLNKYNQFNVNTSLKKVKHSCLEISIFTLITIIIFSILKSETIWKVIVIVITYFLVGISEELLYRKYVLFSLKNINIPVWIANIFQALLFAFIGHFGLDVSDNLIWRFPFGIIFGILSIRHTSITMLGELHGIYDIIMWFYF